MPARSCLRVACLLSSLVPLSRVAAQQWQVDAGGTTVRYDSITTISSGSLTSQVEWTGRQFLAGVGGGLSALETSAWSGQANADLSILFGRARTLGGWGAGILGSAGGTYLSNGYQTTTGRLQSRVLYSRPRAGGWLGLGAATGWTSSGAGGVTGGIPEAGGWIRGPSAVASVQLAPMRLEGYWFTDFNAQAAMSLARADLSAYAGWRGSPAASGIGTTGWAGGAVSWWFTPRIALVATGGSYPGDLLQALPGGTYFSLAVRFANRRADLRTAEAARRTLLVQDSGEHILEFAVPGNPRTVELTGDWTSWERLALQRRGGRWAMRVRLARGIHRFNLVIDGTKWIVPEGYATVDDGFGGKTALLVVP